MGLEIIQMIKKERGITTETLSKLSGVPVGTLNKILNGETKDPKLETLKAIARVLGCTLDDFDDVHSRQVHFTSAGDAHKIRHFRLSDSKKGAKREQNKEMGAGRTDSYFIATKKGRPESRPSN